MPPKPPARTLPTDRLAAVCTEAKRNIDKTIQVIDKLSHRIGQLDLPRHIKEELLAELELAYPRNTHIGDAIAYLKHNKANILRSRERMQRERTAGGPATIPQEVYNYIDKTDEAYTMEDILSYREANGDLPNLLPRQPRGQPPPGPYVRGRGIRGNPRQPAQGASASTFSPWPKNTKYKSQATLWPEAKPPNGSSTFPHPPQGPSTGGHKPIPKGLDLLSPPDNLSDYGPGFQDGVFIVD